MMSLSNFSFLLQNSNTSFLSSNGLNSNLFTPYLLGQSTLPINSSSHQEQGLISTVSEQNKIMENSDQFYSDNILHTKETVKKTRKNQTFENFDTKVERNKHESNTLKTASTRQKRHPSSSSDGNKSVSKKRK